MWYSAPTIADEAISNKHVHRNVIGEPKPTEKVSIEGQKEEFLHNNPPSEPPKPKKKSAKLAGNETSLGEGSKLPANGSSQNCTGKDRLAESAQCALEDEKFKEMFPIYPAGVISNNHKDGIDPKSANTATESPLADKWDLVMQEELAAIGQHQVYGDFMELPEARKALPTHWVYKFKCNGADNGQRIKATLVGGENHQIQAIEYHAIDARTTLLGYGWMALGITSKYDLEIHQMDVYMAFLGVGLDKEIYMHPPQGCFSLV